MRTYGRSVSPFLNVTFNNLISEFSFSQPYFEPTLGETQEVTADFAANCNWTLQIQDVNSNTVLTATGSGDSMTYNWDGTGNGETNLPDGIYTYSLSAVPNGEADVLASGGSGSGGGGSPPSLDAVSSSLTALPGRDVSELWAVPTDRVDNAMPVPLAIYPPGSDPSDLTIFEAAPSEIESLKPHFPHHSQSHQTQAQLLAANVSGGSVIADGLGSGSGGSSANREMVSKGRRGRSAFATRRMEPMGSPVRTRPRDGLIPCRH